jgi:predicted O-linked N-acetylglucosamine transferase (SPINDLY family)
VVHAGVPLVTQMGNTLVSRMGLSILSATNSMGFVAKSASEYENHVVGLFENIKFLKSKQKLTTISFRVGSALACL